MRPHFFSFTNITSLPLRQKHVGALKFLHKNRLPHEQQPDIDSNLPNQLNMNNNTLKKDRSLSTGHFILGVQTPNVVTLNKPCAYNRRHCWNGVIADFPAVREILKHRFIIGLELIFIF